MSGIFGALNLQSTDRVWVSTLGQGLVYDAVNTVLAAWASDLSRAMSTFIERKTFDHKLRYKLPGGGRLQRTAGAAQGAVKAYGQWDTAFPLEDFGAKIAGDRVALAYMSVQDLDRHLDTIMIQDQNTVRFEILYALLHKTQRTFTDPLWGALTPECLANGDTVAYPPVAGSETEATDDHYLESGYAAANISDTNNPLVTMVAELEEHFNGGVTGGSNICTFINNAQTAKISALTNFNEMPSAFYQVGDDTAIARNWPQNVPGKLLGYCDGTWISEWRWMPANYMLSIYLDAPRPLMMRVDPPDVGLGNGDLMLVSRDKNYPLERAEYSHRFGLAVGNRLNGVAMELGTGGTYSIPSTYA